MAKLVTDWKDKLKGMGVKVIDNTDTLPKAEDTFQIPDPAVVQNGKYKRTQIVPMAEVTDTQARQDEVDAALEASRQAREQVEQSNPTYEIDPSQPVSFGDLANMAEENLVVTGITKVAEYTPEKGLVVNDGSMSWDDLVTGVVAEPITTGFEVQDFPPETPIVYVSLDVPDGVEVVFKLNGQELL